MPGRSNFASFVVGLSCAVIVALVAGRLARVGHRDAAIGDATAGVYVVRADARDAAARELVAADHALAAARSAMLSVLAAHFAAERGRGGTMIASADDRRGDAAAHPVETSASGEDATGASMPSAPDVATAAPAHEVATAAPRDDATAAPRHVATAAAAPQLDGEWIVSNAVESTRDQRLRGVEFEYRLRLRQERDRIEGRGSRIAKNGTALPRAHQTPVSVTGTLRDGRVELRFAEHGGRGKREGRFTWETTSNADLLSGSFASDATGTLGRSEARRVVD